MIQGLIKLIIFKNMKNLQLYDCWSKALRAFWIKKLFGLETFEKTYPNWMTDLDSTQDLLKNT